MTHEGRVRKEDNAVCNVKMNIDQRCCVKSSSVVSKRLAHRLFIEYRNGNHG
jgi:hypothetical protein